MKYCYLLILLALFSCGPKSDSDKVKETYKVTNDTIPETRSTVKSEAVASYSEPVKDKDKLNNWKFAVELYETPAMFKYLVKIEYMALNEKDTVTIPNFGILPKVEVRKGTEPLSCIIGFLDKEGEFKPYKQVAVEDKNLKITTLRHYARTRKRVK
jgi:hypothetical protein